MSSDENLTEITMPEKGSGLQSFSKNFGETDESDKLEIDLAVKCRGCFAEDPEMHYLFTVFDQKLSLADILMQTTHYQCREDDGFPPYLCTKCTTCLIDFFNFKIQYQKTDLYVRTLLGKLDQDCQESTETVAVKNEAHSDEGSIGEENDDYEPSYEPEHREDKKVKFEPSEIYDIDGGSQNCDICDLDFINHRTQTTHMAKEHGKNPFTKYQVFRNVVLENERAAMLAKKRLKQKEEDLRQEMLLSMPGKLCRICRVKYPEEEFQAHWEQHKINVCEQCGYKCVRKSDLELHIQGVHGVERKYCCQLCGRGFKTKPLLKRHQVVHLNPRRYCCDLCGQRFNDSGTLKTHMHLKHDGSRDFVCPICGLAFPMKPTLDKHIIRHNKNRPASFYCELCPAAFRDKSSMTRHHLVKHTSEFQRPICQFCGKSYCSKTKLRMHIERHHSGTVYERKRRVIKKQKQDGVNKVEIKEEKHSISSESEESDESSGSDEDGYRRGPRVMNVSEDFYKDDENRRGPRVMNVSADFYKENDR